MRETSRTDYRARNHRVIEYIEGHLGEDLSLDELARIARLSTFHFHRVFRVIIGESLSSFVQRRRLEKAASELHCNRTVSILGVANHYGYENATAFSRAFRRLFGVSPTEWRQQAATIRRSLLFDEKARARTELSEFSTAFNGATWQKITDRSSSSHSRARLERPTIETLPRVHVIAAHYEGSYGTSGISQTWRRIIPRADELGLLHSDTGFIGLLHDDPTITDSSRCRYDACVIVPERVPSTELTPIELSAGEFLVFEGCGSASDRDPMVDAIYAHLLERGLLPACGPILEWCPPKPIADPERGLVRTNYCVRLARS